jgi:hypothetical protein
MAHPHREEKAAELVVAIDGYIAAYVNAKVHMATNEAPLNEARARLQELIAAIIR